MEDRLQQLEKECETLRDKLSEQTELQNEVEMLKNELETSLETHKKLQEVALAFEEENRNMNDKYNTQLRDRAKLDALKIDLEHEIETKSQSYSNLEKRFNKMKEKIDNSESTEEMVYSLQRQNKNKTERIEELQEDLATTKEGSGNRKKEAEDKINKLTKENTELNIKLETYLEEMEELDSRVESLESENQVLKKQVEQYGNIEIYGNNMNEIQELETEKEELTAKLKREIEKREIVENELFKIEEEFENFKLENEQNEIKLSENLQMTSRDLINLQSEFPMNRSGSDSKVILRKKQISIENLEGSLKELSKKVTLLEQEHEILLEENSTLAKANAQGEEERKILKQLTNELEKQLEEVLQQHNVQDKEEREKLQQRIKELEHQLMQQHNERIAEKEHHFTQQQTDGIREYDHIKTDLKAAQEYLRLATDKNSELQDELERSDNAVKQQKDQINIFIEEKQRLNENYNRKISNMKEHEKMSNDDHEIMINQINYHMNIERMEHERCIIDLNLHISRLEDRIIALRNFYEQKSNTSVSTPSPETTPPVAIKNGRLYDSMDDLDTDYRNRRINGDDGYTETDVVSDRELRRLAYKIAASNWSTLPTELRINQREVVQILNSETSDEDKIYRLLVTWRSDSKCPRNELIKHLLESIDPKRKEVHKFLRELSGEETKESSGIRNRLQKFKKSMKRL